MWLWKVSSATKSVRCRHRQPRRLQRHIAAEIALESKVLLAGFTPGNLVVSVAGTGGTLDASATVVTLQEYGLDNIDAPTVATLVNSIAAPSANAGNNSGNLTDSGNADSNGTLNLSVDGTVLTFMGYDAPLGLATVVDTTAANNNRVIGLADASGTMTVGPRLTNTYSGTGGNARGAVTVDGSTFWTAGNTGIRYVSTNLPAQTTSAAITTTPSARSVSIATDRNNNRFLVGNSAASVFAWQTPSPTLPTVTTPPQTLSLPSLQSQLGQVVMLDRSVSAGATGMGGIDTIYVTNGQSSTTGLVAKYEWNGSSWASRGTRTFTNGLNGLTARVNETGVVELFVTTRVNNGNNQLLYKTDTSNFGSDISQNTFSVLANAGTGYAFRGLAFAADDGLTTNALGGFGGATTVNVGGAAVAVANAAVLTDGSSFKAGSLSITGGQTGDTMSISSITGQITTSGSNVLFNGTPIGTFSGGSGTTALTVNFNTRNSSTDVSSAAVTQLMRQIQFSTTAADSSRTLTFTVQQAKSHLNQTLSRSATQTININQAPTAVALQNTTTSLPEQTLSADLKVADIVVTDDALGAETITLTGDDAAAFVVVGTELFLKAGTYDFETKAGYAVTINVDDPTVGLSPDVMTTFNLSLTDVVEDSIAPTATFAALPSTRTNGVSSITVNFSEDVTGVDLNDFQLTRNGVAVALTGVTVTQVTPSQYTLGGDLSVLTSTSGDYVLTLAAGGSSIVDFANNPLVANASVSWTNLQITGFLVQNGETQRSFVNQLDVTFGSASGLDTLVSSGRVRLIRNDLDGLNGVATSVGTVTAVGSTLKFHFGTQGVGGNRVNTAYDGYYQLQFDLDGNGTFEQTRAFYRLLGDFNGDKQVTSTGAGNDVELITAAMALPYNAIYDIDGNGVVNAVDRLKVQNSAKVNRKLLGTLVING